jgi:hypothetical protein
MRQDEKVWRIFEKARIPKKEFTFCNCIKSKGPFEPSWLGVLFANLIQINYNNCCPVFFQAEWQRLFSISLTMILKMDSWGKSMLFKKSCAKGNWKRNINHVGRGIIFTGTLTLKFWSHVFVWHVAHRPLHTNHRYVAAFLPLYSYHNLPILHPFQFKH